jgi:hypothetical protein
MAANQPSPFGLTAGLPFTPGASILTPGIT